MPSKRKKAKKSLRKDKESLLTNKATYKQSSLVEERDVGESIIESGSDWFEDLQNSTKTTPTKDNILQNSDSETNDDFPELRKLKQKQNKKARSNLMKQHDNNQKKRRKAEDSDDDKLFQPKRSRPSEDVHSIDAWQSEFPQNNSDETSDDDNLTLTQRNTELNRQASRASEISFDLEESCETPRTTSKSLENEAPIDEVLDCSDPHPTVSEMELIKLKPSYWTKLHTRHAIAYNMASYNIDCQPHHDKRVNFYGPRPKVMDTPVSLLMTKENKVNDNDIFLSDDDISGELVDYSSDQVKLVSPEEIVLERGIIP